MKITQNLTTFELFETINIEKYFNNISYDYLHYQLFLAIACISYAQFTRRTIQESLTIDSKILGQIVKYTIYSPFDYITSNHYCPVVYLLHELGDNYMNWIQFSDAHIIADEAITTRKISPIIIARFDGGTSVYMSNYDDSLRHEEFFIEEVHAYIEQNYRIRNEKIMPDYISILQRCTSNTNSECATNNTTGFIGIRVYL